MNIITNKDKADAARCVWTRWRANDLTAAEAHLLWQGIDATPVGATCLPAALPAAPEPLAIEPRHALPELPDWRSPRIVLERVTLERRP